MQDRSCEQTVPLSLMLKEAYSSEKRSHEGYSENTSEASSSHDSFYDSLSDMHDGEFSNELSAFLSQEEINKSLDLAREAIANSKKEDQNTEQELSHYFNTSLPISSENASSRETKVHEQEALGRPQIRSPISLSITPQTFQEQLKQQSPMSPRTASSFFSGKEANISPLLPASPSFIRSLKNAQKCGPSLQKTSSKSKSVLQGDAPFKSKLCDKAATFIEELSSIFREAAKTRGRSPDGDSSSPDSGYLSPKKKQSAMMNATVSQIPGETYEKSKSEIELSGEHQNGEPFHEKKNVTQQNETVLRHQLSNVGGQKSSAPRFIQKLKSQEVAEGTKVLLSCRVAGNPIPHVRWFCEGKELQNTPDIQIRSESGGLHSLIIAEAFEDDTGRYTCLASNSIGSDSTSAEVFIEGASSTDSESENSVFKSKSGAMPQAQKKTTSVSLTIGSSAPKAGVTTAVIQPISVPSQQVQSPTSCLYRLDGSKPGCCAPIFTKELQNSTASEGQVVVLECRVRGTPPVHVKWFRQDMEIQDSPDFRILQKSKTQTPCKSKVNIGTIQKTAWN